MVKQIDVISVFGCTCAYYTLQVLATILVILILSCGEPDSAQANLTFWAMGAEGEHVKQLIPLFEKRYPQIKVRVQSIPWGAAHEKLLTAYAGNAVPDVCQVGNTWIPELQALDALLQLDSFMVHSSTIGRESFFQGSLETNLINGKTFGLPWYVDTRVLFYRKDILARAGYDKPPQTWEEMFDAGRAIQQLHPESSRKYAFYFSLIFNDGYVPVMLVMANGGKFLRENNSYGAFDDSRTIEAFRYYLSFFKGGLASRSVTEFPNIYQSFANGDIAMMVHGPWVVNEMRKRLKSSDAKIQWSTVRMPKKKSRTSLAFGASLIIFKDSPHKEAAWKLIEFLSEVETQSRFFSLTGDLPSVREAWNTPELQNDSEISTFYQQLEDVAPTPLIPEWEQIYVKIQENLELVIYDKMTLEAAVGKLNSEVDQILEKRRWLLARKLLE